SGRLIQKLVLQAGVDGVVTDVPESYAVPGNRADAIYKGQAEDALRGLPGIVSVKGLEVQPASAEAAETLRAMLASPMNVAAVAGTAKPAATWAENYGDTLLAVPGVWAFQPHKDDPNTIRIIVQRPED